MLVRRRANLRRAPRQERSSFTFEAILDAAEELILARGVDAVHMAPLAKRAGVSVGSLYQYFPDKGSIVAALLERSTSRFVAGLRQAFGASREAPLDLFLEQVSAAVAELVSREHRLTRTLRAALVAAPESEGETEDLSDVAAGLLTAALKGRVDVPEERLLPSSRLMVWAADGMVEGAFRRAEVSIVEIQEGLLAAWRGILGGHESSSRPAEVPLNDESPLTH